MTSRTVLASLAVLALLAAAASGTAIPAAGPLPESLGCDAYSRRCAVTCRLLPGPGDALPSPFTLAWDEGFQWGPWLPDGEAACLGPYGSCRWLVESLPQAPPAEAQMRMAWAALQAGRAGWAPYPDPGSCPMLRVRVSGGFATGARLDHLARLGPPARGA